MRNVIIIGNKELNPICRDYGIPFAESLGFEFYDFRESFFQKADVIIVDMMIPTKEFINWVRSTAFNWPNAFFRFVDDCPYTNNEFMNEIRIDFRYSSELGRRIISPYTYERMDRYVPTVIPYHYIKEDERPFGSNRIPQAILSGCKDAGYVMRYDLYERFGESPYIVKKVHPGYKNGEPKSEYLSKLAEYKVMIMTTDQDFELLKYVECAEAGCCPIGEFPSSLLTLMPPKLKWLQCHTSTKLIQRVKEVIDNWYEYAKMYRKFMKSIRSADIIRKKYMNLI